MVLEQDLETFRQAVETLWNKLAALTGVEPTAALFRAVIHDVAIDRPLLRTIVVTSQGVSLRLFIKNAQAFPEHIVHDSMTHFLNAFLERIRDLGGPVLARSLRENLPSFFSPEA